MSAMVNLEIPWINIMSKMDLVSNTSEDPASGRNGVRKRRNIARFVYVFRTCSFPICPVALEASRELRAPWVFWEHVADC